MVTYGVDDTKVGGSGGGRWVIGIGILGEDGIYEVNPDGGDGGDTGKDSKESGKPPRTGGNGVPGRAG